MIAATDEWITAGFGINLEILFLPLKLACVLLTMLNVFRKWVAHLNMQEINTCLSLCFKISALKVSIKVKISHTHSYDFYHIQSFMDAGCLKDLKSLCKRACKVAVLENMLNIHIFLWCLRLLRNYNVLFLVLLLSRLRRDFKWKMPFRLHTSVFLS